MTGIPAEGVSRESLRDGLNAFGTVKYVDFSFGEREAWVRYVRGKNKCAPRRTCAGRKLFGKGKEGRPWSSVFMRLLSFVKNKKLLLVLLLYSTRLWSACDDVGGVM